MLRTLVFVALAAVAAGSGAAEPSADRIAQESAAIDGGRDAVATLTFLIDAPGEARRKLVYDMAWKNYDHGDVRLKAIFTTQFPPDNLGEAYMGWFYRPAAHRDSDEWIYLPSLRSVRKLGHVHGAEDKEHDEFSRSVLQDAELMPRDPGQDTHRLLRHESLDGRDFYVVEYTPRKAMGGMDMDGMDMGSDYSKSLRWIDSKTMLLRRVDYYDAKGEAVKRQLFSWRRIGDKWVWDRVEGQDLKTGARTTLQISDMRINLGLADRVFTQRTMRLGLQAAVR